MHITDIIRGGSPTFSFEFFPPKTPEAAESLYQTIRELEEYMPHFVSVTYGAGGSTRDLTHDLVERIQNKTKLDPIPHLTCVCHTEAEINAIIRRYAKACISNILALGGDPPRGCAYDKSKDAFQNAADLVRFIRRFNESGVHPDPRGFGIGVAGFPELAGGARFPAKLLRALQRSEDDPKMVARVGVHFALEQCHDLLDNHVAGIHFYTLNKSDATRTIFDSLGIPRRQSVEARPLTSDL